MTQNQKAFMKAGNKYIFEYLRAAQDLLQEEESDDWHCYSLIFTKSCQTDCGIELNDS